MPDRHTCRNPSCDEEPRGREYGITLEEGRFCSRGCKIKFAHLEDDARDAERAAAEEDRREPAAHDQRGVRR